MAGLVKNVRRRAGLSSATDALPPIHDTWTRGWLRAMLRTVELDDTLRVPAFDVVIEVKVRDAPIYQGSSRVGITVLQVGQRVRVTGVWEHD